MLTRAYSVLRVKRADPDTRTITGTASTPEPDRLGDIVEPLGITFKNPVPLLLYHDTKRPVGSVRFFPPTADGLDFEATLPSIDDPGTLKDRIDEAWQSITTGLLAAVSIGFRAIEETYMTDTQAFRFLKTEVLELSLVTIPANAGATIDTIKSLDRAALGARESLPSDVGPSARVVRAIRSTAVNKYGDQIKTWEATRAAKAARQVDLMATATDAGVTLDGAQADEFDTLAADIKGIDAHLVRLRATEQANLAAAVPVTGTDPTDGANARGASPRISVKSTVPPATGFIRYVRAIAIARGNLMQAAEIAKQWRDSTPEVELAIKAAVAAGTTTDATWAGPLAPLTPLASEFMALLRPATVIGKIGTLRQVPFNVSVPQQTGGGSYSWVGEGAPKPVSKLAFSATTLGIAKCTGIIVISEELARVSTPSAEEVIRADMIAGIAQFLDVAFTDPTKAAVANVSPASITNGLTPITSAGTTPSNARTDIQALASAMLGAPNYISTARAVLIMSETNALALTSALNNLGQPLFPDMTPTGGIVMGYRVIPSQAVGNNVIMVNGEGILMADDGGVEIDVSREASVQMDSAPDNPALATTILTSLWQNNLVGLRADRFINWKRARAGTVQYTQQTYVA